MGVMDLDGMEIEDNKGGRPPKDEQETKRDTIEAQGDTYTMRSDDHYWNKKWDHFYNEDDDVTVRQAVIRTCGNAHVLPRTGVQKIQESGAHDFNETLDEYPEAEEYLDGKNGEGVTEDANDKDNSPSSGLKALINDS